MKNREGGPIDGEANPWGVVVEAEELPRDQTRRGVPLVVFFFLTLEAALLVQAFRPLLAAGQVTRPDLGDFIAIAIGFVLFGLFVGLLQPKRIIGSVFGAVLGGILGPFFVFFMLIDSRGPIGVLPMIFVSGFAFIALIASLNR